MSAATLLDLALAVASVVLLLVAAGTAIVAHDGARIAWQRGRSGALAVWTGAEVAALAVVLAAVAVLWRVVE